MSGADYIGVAVPTKVFSFLKYLGVEQVFIK